METQGLTKDQMLLILSCMSDEQLRNILSSININSSSETSVQQGYTESPVVNSYYPGTEQEAASPKIYDEPVADYEEQPETFSSRLNGVAENIGMRDYTNVAMSDPALVIVAFRSRYIEICEYLLTYEFSAEVKEELRKLSQGLYDLYQVVSDELTQFKIVLYQKYINKIYDEEKVSINPYSEIAAEMAYYFLNEAMGYEWFRKYVGARTITELEHKTLDESDFSRNKRQKLLSPIKVDVRWVDQYIKILKDYAFDTRHLLTSNDGDRAVFTVTDSITGSFLNHEDNENYLNEGLKYYLHDMMAYKKSL